MIEFNAEQISENELMEAADKIFKSEEKDFDKIKSEKWYQTLFHAITLNQDGKKYAVRGIHSLAKLQQLFMEIYVKNYKETHSQLNEVIDAVVQNSIAIKQLYNTCVLQLKEQEELSALSPNDAEILALFLGEYKNGDGEIPEKVREYNRGVLMALNKGIPYGTIGPQQIAGLKEPKVVYRCFMEQCAVDGTIETQEWSDSIYDLLKYFELGEYSKSQIRESVRHELDVAGADYFMVKYAKENAGVLDTDFVIELGGENDISPEEEELRKAQEAIELCSLSMTVSQFEIELLLGNYSGALEDIFNGDYVGIDSLNDGNVVSDEEFLGIPLEVLKRSVKDSLDKENGFVKGYKFETTKDYVEYEKHYFLIITVDFFFFFTDRKIAVVPIDGIRTVSETGAGLEIQARKVDWYSETGNEIEGGNVVIIKRDKETKSYIRSYRKALELIIDKFGGYISNPEIEVENILESRIKKISKSSPTYMAKNISYSDEKGRKRLKRALSKYALKVYEDDVIGFIDTSLMNNGGDGLLFSKEGISFDYAFEKVFLRYSEINRMSFDKKHKTLLFHGNFTERENDNTIPSINDIYYNLDELKGCIEQIQYVV